jgi:hypothetical protein
MCANVTEGSVILHVSQDPDRKPVPCFQCGEVVPISEAKSFEAVDYVIYFCGLDCYAEWAAQED